jgi:hypothetical protein
MTWTTPTRPRHEPSGFAEARAAAERVEAAQKFHAARTVASNSVDSTECREFLDMLGLNDSPPDTEKRHAYPYDRRSTR